MSKNVEGIMTLFQSKRYLLDMGARTIAKRFGLSEDDVREARRIIRGNIKQLKKNSLKEDTYKKGGPKILIFDIETAPLRAYVWGRWKQNIYLEQTLSEWFMLSWSAKWLGENVVYSDVVTSEEVLEESDTRIVKKLWQLFDEADIVVAHNAKRFDVPKCNARFLMAGLYPPSYYKVIDTLDTAKRQFGFSSNKLDNLAIMFKIPCKLSTGFKLWSDCMKGDKEALSYMEEYNQHDVEILEEVYLKLRPYIKAHPNYNLYANEDVPVCPTCGSKHLEHDGYHYYTPTCKYENFRCLSCGALARARKSVLKNKNILISN